MTMFRIFTGRAHLVLHLAQTTIHLVPTRYRIVYEAANNVGVANWSDVNLQCPKHFLTSDFRLNVASASEPGYERPCAYLGAASLEYLELERWIRDPAVVYHGE
jgi:hypothetical protein